LDEIEDEEHESEGSENDEMEKLWNDSFKSYYDLHDRSYMPDYPGDEPTPPYKWREFIMESPPTGVMKEAFKKKLGNEKAREIHHAKVKLLVIEYYIQYESNFDRNGDSCTWFVYRRIEKQKKRWKKWLKVLKN